MPRSRSKQATTDENQTEGENRMADNTSLIELDEDVIEGLLAGSRQRGTYDGALDQFIDSDSKGIQVNTAEGEFASKKTQSLKTGFDGAKRRRADSSNKTYYKEDFDPNSVRVIVKEDKVFLVRAA